MKQVILTVPDISCEHCERAITNALSPVAGVSHVAVDIEGKQVEVSYDEDAVTVDQLKNVLQEEEYPVASATSA
jgi:copper chaperone